MSCGLPSNLLKILFDARWGRSRVFISAFDTTGAKCNSYISLAGDRQTSPAVVWALYAKDGSEPLTRSSFSNFTTLSLVSSNQVCGAHELSPLQMRGMLEDFQNQMVAKVSAKKPFYRAPQYAPTQLKEGNHNSQLTPQYAPPQLKVAKHNHTVLCPSYLKGANKKFHRNLESTKNPPQKDTFSLERIRGVVEKARPPAETALPKN